MSRYREPEYYSDKELPDFDDIERLEKLLEGKKLTDKQKESLRKLIRFYYSMD